MRIEQFEIDAFGQLKDFRAEGLSGHPLLVVHGDNESGKTTLREFLATVLYGFSPAQADHPYTPWSGGTPGGRVALRLDDGRTMRLDRQLRDVAEGRLSATGSPPVELGNRPLPATGPVDRAIWDDVHAPRRDAPDGLSESTWALVRERLLGGVGAPGLRTAREATRSLEARAAELWQPSRRARTRHRVLSVRIRRLLKERERAAAELQRLLELRRQIGSRTGLVKGMEEQLGETRSRLLRAERLLPVVRGIQHAEDLRRRVSQALPQDDFPHDARMRIAELRSAAQATAERSTALAAELASHEQRGMLSLQDQAVLASEDEVRTLVSEAAVHQQDLVHVNDLTRERDAQEAVFRERSANVFSGPLDAERREVLGRLGLAELRSRIMDWEDANGSPEQAQEELRQAKEQVKTCEMDFEAVPSADAERKLRQREELMRQLQAREDAWQALKKDVEAVKLARDVSSKRMRRPHQRITQSAGLFLASGCTLLTLLFGAMAAWWFVVPAGAALAWFGWKTLKGKSESGPVLGDENRYESAHKECLALRKQLQLHEFEPVAGHIEKAQQSLAHVASRPELERRLVLARQRADECATRVQERAQECEKVRKRVVEFVAALPMLPARLEQPGQDLLHDLEELRAALRAMSRLTGEQQAVAQRAREREARAARLAERLESNQHRSPMEASAIWHERLQLALSAKRRADESARALPTLRERGREYEAASRTAAGELRAFEERLAKLDEGGKSDAGLRVVEQARLWRIEADEIEASLRRQFPDWLERSSEAHDAVRRGEQLDLSTEQRVALAEQIGQLEAGLAKAREELDLMSRERDELARRRPLADVDGAVAALREQRAQLERQRDRLVAQAQLVRLADERWRARWQAPVLTTASAHLSMLTGGRWERLSIETADGHTRLFMKRWDAETLYEVAEPMSRAARAQAWLALRLALADQLDGEEPLPLVMDDPFGDWDASRVKQAAGLLAAVGQRRQIIVLTGQSSVADQFESQVKACILRLPAAPGAPGSSAETAMTATSGATLIPSIPPTLPSRPRRRGEQRRGPRPAAPVRTDAPPSEMPPAAAPQIDAPPTISPPSMEPSSSGPGSMTTTLVPPTVTAPTAAPPAMAPVSVAPPIMAPPELALPTLAPPEVAPPTLAQPALAPPSLAPKVPAPPTMASPAPASPMPAPTTAAPPTISLPDSPSLSINTPVVSPPTQVPWVAAPRIELPWSPPLPIEAPRAQAPTNMTAPTVTPPTVSPWNEAPPSAPPRIEASPTAEPFKPGSRPDAPPSEDRPPTNV